MSKRETINKRHQHFSTIWCTIFYVIFFFISTNLSSQYYSTGSDPASLKWRQIKTPYVRIVFEKSLEKEAFRLAYLFDSIAPLVSGTMKHTPKRIDLLIHNQMSYSNGMISWAPRRMEFFSMPNQNITSVDWLTELAIHEYRHVIQADKLNKGETKFASYFIGQQAVGIVLGYSLPMWFIEGDAVISETSLTKSGRGRSFEFNQELKAQLVERGKFTFDKAYMGSYKEKVPNYYKMGYPLTALIRQQYGANVWEQVVEQTGRKNSLSQMNKPLKKITGFNNKKLYDEQFSKLKDIWTEEVNSYPVTHFSEITTPKTDYETYQYPKAINDSIIVCEVNAPSLRSKIVEINILTGIEKTLAYTGIREEEPISANEWVVVWAEIKYNIRWENQSFSVIRIYDRITGKTKTLENKTRYFAPAIHPVSPVIAAVEGTPDYLFYIALLDINSGKVIKRIPTPDNQFVLTPSWNNTDDNLITILLNENGRAIYTLNPENEEWTMILNHSFDEKNHPVQFGNDIWYAAKGVISQEIYYYNIETKEKTLVTASKFGAANPTILPSSKQLIYSHYTAAGYHPVKFVPSNVKPNMANLGNSFIDKLAYDLSLQETAFIKDTVQKIEYKAQKYSKFNLINIHSWAPIYADFTKQTVGLPGVSMMSQNLLGTSILTAGIDFNKEFRDERYNLCYSYYGFYPVLGIDFSFGDEHYKEKESFYKIGKDTVGITNTKANVFRIRPSVKIPFNLSSGNYQRQLVPGVRLNYRYRERYSYHIKYYTFDHIEKNKIVLRPTGREEVAYEPVYEFFGMDYSLYFYNIRRGTSRDVAPRFGQLFQVLYAHAPFGNVDVGSLMGFFTKFYFPGFSKYHSISIEYGFQERIAKDRKGGGSENYYAYNHWTNWVGNPRGYYNELFHNNLFYKDNISLLRLNYMMPLINPDFSVCRIAYFKRIRTNLFYDMAFVNYSMILKKNNSEELYNYKPASCGLELYTDFHAMRFTLPFSIGWRFGYRLGDNIYKNNFFNEFILSTSFGGFLVK